MQTLLRTVFAKPLFLFLMLCMVSFLDCQTDSKTPPPSSLAASTAIPLPSTPEDVVKMWETNYDQNNFAAIEPISTGESLALVRSVGETNKIAVEKGEKVEAFSPEIVQVSCTPNGDLCDCVCLINDPQAGRYNMKYELVKENGQWKVANSGDEAEMNEKAKKTKKPL